MAKYKLQATKTDNKMQFVDHFYKFLINLYM